MTPMVYLYENQEKIATLRLPQVFWEQVPGLIRHPLRLPSQVDGIGLAFNMQQQPTIRFDGVSVYRQQPSSRDRALIESYDRVPVDDRHVEALASWQGNSGS